MKKLVILLVLSLVALICQADVLQFQCDAGHTGQSSEVVIANGLLWRDSLANIDALSGPVTLGDSVFVPTANGFYCLNAANGDSIWCQAGSFSFSGVPAIISDRIVVVKAETLACFSLTGNHLWSIVFPTTPSYPTVADGIIYLTAGRKVYAIDSSGVPRWVSEELRYGFERNMTPCCYDTFVVVATKRGGLVIDPASVVYVLNLNSGAIIDSCDYGYGFAENGCLSTPTLLDNRLYFTTYHTLTFPGYIRSARLPENTQRWETRNVPTYYASSAASANRVFFSGEGLRCYDSTGTRLWVAEIGRVSYSSPIISADGTIWVGNDNGTFYGVDATSGLIRFSYQCDSVPLTSPATTSSGRLVICDTSGNVYCFGYCVVAIQELPMTTQPQLRPGIYDITGRRYYIAPPGRGVYFRLSGGRPQKMIIH